MQSDALSWEHFCLSWLTKGSEQAMETTLPKSGYSCLLEVVIYKWFQQ